MRRSGAWSGAWRSRRKDVPVILGMLRQILWKLQEPKP